MEQQDEQKEKLEQENQGETENTIAEKLESVSGTAEEKIEEVKAEANEAGEKAEEMAKDLDAQAEEAAKAAESKMEEVATAAESKMEEVATATESKVEEVATAAESKVEEVATAAESKVEEVVQAAESKAEEVVEAAQAKAEELAQGAEGKAEELSQGAEEKIAELGTAAAATTAAAGEAVGEKLSEVKKTVETETDKKVKEIKAKKQAKEMEKSEKQGKSNSAIIVGVAVGLILLVLASFFALFPRKTKLDLDKYVTVSFDGYDGYGKAMVQFDKDAYLKDYKKKIKLKKSGNFLQDSLTQNYGAEELLYDFYIDGRWVIEGATDGKLKNGDKVKFAWKLNQEELEENFKLKLSSKGQELDVQGLKDVKLFDAFQNLDIKFTGISPDGSVEWKGTGDMDGSKGYYFTVEPSMDLKNGDKVKIKIEPKNPEALIQKYGMAPKEMEKEITVEGLPSYVDKAEDVSESLLQDMQKELTDKIQSQIANQGEQVSFVGAEYLGYYFLNAKSKSAFEHNIIFPVMKVNVQINIPDKSYSAQHSYYFTGSFENIMDEGNGKITVDLNDMSIPYHYASIDTGVTAWFSTIKFNFSGFEDLNSLRNQCVSQKLDKYTVEETVKDLASKTEESVAESQAEGTTESSASESASATESSAANP